MDTICVAITRGDSASTTEAGYLDDAEALLDVRRPHRHRRSPIEILVQSEASERSSGAAPLFTSDDGATVVAVLGDLVDRGGNVRSALEAAGRTFREPRSASELLYHLFDAGKERLLESLDGTFCFVVWDARTGRLTAVPDRNGLRSFYYFDGPDTFVCSSSLKGVLAHRDIPRAFDPGAVNELLEIGFVVPPDTVVRDVKLLRADQTLEFGRSLRVLPSPARDSTPRIQGDFDERCSAYVGLFETAVLAALDGKKNPSLIMSGGMDSGAIASVAYRNGVKLETFTIDVSPEREELAGARRLSKLFGTSHHELAALPRDAMDRFPEVVWLAEAPSSIVVNGATELALAKAVGNETSVVLTGDGNDLAWGVIPINEHILAERGGDLSRVYARFRRVEPAALIAPLLRDAAAREEALVAKIGAVRPRTGRPFDDVVAADQALYGANVHAEAVRAFRLHATPLLWRFPFLDSRLKRFVDALSADDKMRDLAGTPTRKYLMKSAIEANALLPSDIVHRKKTWMFSPSPNWLRREGKGVAERILFGPSAACADYVDVAGLRRLWEAHQARDSDATTPLMTLLAIEVWRRLFVDVARPSKPDASLGEMFA